MIGQVLAHFRLAALDHPGIEIARRAAGSN